VFEEGTDSGCGRDYVPVREADSSTDFTTSITRKVREDVSEQTISRKEMKRKRWQARGEGGNCYSEQEGSGAVRAAEERSRRRGAEERSYMHTRACFEGRRDVELYGNGERTLLRQKSRREVRGEDQRIMWRGEERRRRRTEHQSDRMVAEGWRGKAMGRWSGRLNDRGEGSQRRI